MGFIVADSGSSKTDWALYDQAGKLHRMQTTGLNPSYQSEEQLLSIVRNELDNKWLIADVEELHYYGAGCSGGPRTQKMKQALRQLFPGIPDIKVAQDLTGAAKACFGDREGLIAILGTGSNIGYYDGKTVNSLFPALGHLLGDEGGGVDLGKSLLKKFLYRELPPELMEAFTKKYGFTDDQLIVEMYKAPSPNRFIASFSPFLDEHKDHPFIKKMIIGCLDHFFVQHVCKYNNHENLSIGFIGSIASVYEVFLREVAEHHKIKFERVVRSPIEDLINYHIKRQS